MKALSLGLVKGSIDEVERKVHMTWVQPRVLDRDQVMSIMNCFLGLEMCHIWIYNWISFWCGDVR